MSLLDVLKAREFNPKYIVLSAGVVGAYWLLPPRSAPLAVALDVGTYIGIAHYDSMFACEERLHSFDEWFAHTFGRFKPPVGADSTYRGKVSLFSGCGIVLFRGGRDKFTYLF